MLITNSRTVSPVWPYALGGRWRKNVLPVLAALLATIPASVSGADAPADVPYPGLSSEIPEVLTTTRLRQPKTRVPGSTTVITGDLIRNLGIVNLYEVFRLVPGMVVNFVGSHSPVTTYHGTVHYEQRRMQVLVDGRTAHRATLSDMDWETMPVPLEMIERIEVARGPNSAAYGINAFLGTINIITRDPADTAGASVKVTRGSRGHLRTFASVGDATQNYDWRLTYEKRKFDGFDYQIDEGQRLPFEDGHHFDSFTYDSRLLLNPRADLEIRGGVINGTNHQDRFKSGELGPHEHPDIEVRDFYLQTRLNYATSDRHSFWINAGVENFDRRQVHDIAFPDNTVQCLRNGTPLYQYTYFNSGQDRERLCFTSSGGQPGLASVNSNSEDTRMELELQDTLLFSDNLKLVSGAGFRKDTYRSETYFNGRGSSYHTRYFGNLEYTPLPWFTLNTGGNWERTSTTDEGYFSPRVAANFTLNNQHALRFVFSRAVRTPDEFEQNPDWGYTLRNVRPDIYSDLEGIRVDTLATVQDLNRLTLGETLEEERITSHEISYFGHFHLERALLSLEVRGFRDELRDMISGVIQLKDWSIANNVAADQKGFEVEATLDFPGTSLRASYGYLDQDTWYTGAPILDANGNPDTGAQDRAVRLLTRMSVRHSGSLAAIQELPLGFRIASAFYWADEFNTQFERIDTRLSKQFYGPRYSAELAFILQHYLNREPELSSDNNIRNHNQLFVEAGLKF
ncbi:MAG TPA: TonB-dependent receptor [Marinobacter sp.]|nr:TonB-dependent receptor [Marinobacter sp.]